MAGHEVCGDFMFGRRNWFTHQLTSILPHFMSSSQNETTATGSDSRRTKEAIEADRNAMARVRALYRMGKELGMF